MLPVIEEVGERRLAVRLLNVFLAVFGLSCYRGPVARGRLNFQAHLHLVRAESLQVGLALTDAGDGLHASPQLHLQRDVFKHI